MWGGGPLRHVREKIYPILLNEPQITAQPMFYKEQSLEQGLRAKNALGVPAQEWGAGEGVGWGRKETGVSTGWRGPVFGIKHDKLLKFFRLYSRNASQNSPFGEEFIHWSPSFVGQSCALQDANSLCFREVCMCFSRKIFTFQSEQESPGAGQQGPGVDAVSCAE